MESSSVNKLFVRAIESLGYSKEEYKKYLDVFDTKRKIQTVASLFTVAERKCKVRECLEELKSRHSLVNLLFLRYAVETMSQNDSSRRAVWECFMENDGLSVLECGFGSGNPKFLDNLMEFVIFVLKTHGECTSILEKILPKYELIDKRLIHLYLNMNVDRKALLMRSSCGVSESQENATCVCSLFIKRVVDDILRMDKIENELDFVMSEKLRLDLLINREHFKSLENRFVNKVVFKRLLGILDSTTGDAASHTAGADRNLPMASRYVSTGSANAFADGPRALDRRCERADAEMFEHSRSVPSQEVFPMDCSDTRPKAMLEDITRQYESLKSEHLDLKNFLSRNGISIAGQKVIQKPLNEGRALEMLSAMKVDSQRRPKFCDRVVDCRSECGPAIRAQKHDVSAVTSPSKTVSTAEASLGDPVRAGRSSAVKEKQAGKPKFSAGRFGAKAKPKKSVLVSDKSYIGIKWKKASKSQSLIFSKISYEDSERLFELAEFDKFECRQERKVRQEKKTRETVGSVCMDPKKSYALNIALGRVRAGNRELIDKIVAQECEDENLVKQLIMYFPTSEEIDLIRGCKSPLSRAEMLFEEACEPKVFYDSLIALRFKFCFRNRDYHGLFSEMSNVFRRVVQSTELLNLFGALLVVGNVLNSNSFNGGAEGFTLDSLEGFCNDAVLELLSRKVCKSRLIMELTGHPQDGDSVALLGCGVSVETVISEFGEVRSMFVEECVDQGTKEVFSAACERFDEMMRHYKDAQAYFGECDDKFIVKLERFIRKLK